jgi:hypothetical protein
MSTALIPTCQTASEAISLIRTTRARLTRITDLLGAIRNDVIHGQAFNIDALTDIAQQLGEDWGFHLDMQIELLQSQLNATVKDEYHSASSRRRPGPDRCEP